MERPRLNHSVPCARVHYHLEQKPSCAVSRGRYFGLREDLAQSDTSPASRWSFI
jgi:hypothetical protein